MFKNRDLEYTAPAQDAVVLSGSSCSVQLGFLYRAANLLYESSPVVYLTYASIRQKNLHYLDCQLVVAVVLKPQAVVQLSLREDYSKKRGLVVTAGSSTAMQVIA